MTTERGMPREVLDPNRIEMDFVGDPQVILNILRKSELLRRGDPSHLEIRTAEILPGGGQRGVYQGGVQVAMESLGLIDAVDSFVAVSCGVASAYYALGGHAAMGTTIYHEENARNRLFNLARVKRIFDADTLEWVFRHEKPIDYNYLKSRRSQFFAAVTDAETGDGRFVDVKAMEDPLSALMASVNIPLINGGKVVEVDGRACFDGGLFQPLPVSWTVNNLNPTDILVILNHPLHAERGSLRNLLPFARLLGLNPKIIARIATYSERYRQELAYVTGETPLPKGVRIAAIYPKRSRLRSHTTNGVLLKQAADVATRFTERLFSTA